MEPSRPATSNRTLTSPLLRERRARLAAGRSAGNTQPDIEVPVLSARPRAQACAILAARLGERKPSARQRIKQLLRAARKEGTT